MRVLVTGREGQVATAMLQARSPGLEVVAVGRPELDLERPETVARTVGAVRPDVVISAAAYTAVDAAEGDRETAFRVNADGAGELARAARAIGAPVLHLSTDYVFDGAKPAPYVEADVPSPQGVYGLSKLAGERSVLEAQPESLVLRTAWVYAPFGKNFVRTMLRLAETRDEVGVVADQQGCPTSALDIADALAALAVKARARQAPFGIAHMAATGEASWADFARAVFAGSVARGGPSADVRSISTADYPTPAARPANSRLDCGKLDRDWGVRLPPWRKGLDRVLDALLGPVREEVGA